MIRIGPTRDEKRYAALRAIGCIVCRLKGYSIPCGMPEMHHLVDKGYRKHSGGNLATIPLGIWHHRGEPRIDYTATEMRQIWGPSRDYILSKPKWACQDESRDRPDGRLGGDRAEVTDPLSRILGRGRNV